MKTRSFKDLIVWQRSMELCIDVYEVCKKLPGNEQFGLSIQMKRAAVSIPSNIAEGYKRHNLGEYTHFCDIAEGSAAELETQLILTNKLFGINISQALDLLIEVQKMLYVLVQQLKTKR